MKFTAIFVLCAAAAATANADTWTEVADAGAALAPQQTGLLSGQTLEAIMGTAGMNAAGQNVDIDSFRVHINGDWGASTVGNGTTWDTMLFLSSLDGSTLLAFNDDNGGGLQSTISGALADGDYVLSISRFANSLGTVPLVDPSNGLGGVEAYTITCRGMTTVAPTPGSLALLGLGGLAAARRRRAR